jgi:hypothetical protein
MGTEDEELEEEYDDPNDPFGLNRPQSGRRRTSLGKLAQQNAVVRRKGSTEDGRESIDPFVVGFGKLDDERTDEERDGFRPGTYYRPFF